MTLDAARHDTSYEARAEGGASSPEYVAVALVVSTLVVAIIASAVPDPQADGTNAGGRGDLVRHELVHVEQFEQYGDVSVAVHRRIGPRRHHLRHHFERPADEKNWPCPHE